MALYANTSGSNTLIFPNTVAMSNITIPYCSYYTSGSNFTVNNTAEVFLKTINFSNVYKNLETGLSNVNTLNFSNIQYTPSEALNTYLDSVQTQVLQLGFITNCITEKPDMTDTLFLAEKQRELSKDRYDHLHSSEEKVSYYEGTFPIYRPLKENTLFVLFAAGIFFILLALFIFLRTQGVEVNVILPSTVTLPGISSIPSTSSLSSFFSSYSFFITASIVIGIGAGYGIQKYYYQ